MTVELGDQLYAKKTLRRRARVLSRRLSARTDRAHAERSASPACSARSTTTSPPPARDPAQVGHLGAANNQLKADIAKAQKLLAEFAEAAECHARDLHPAWRAASTRSTRSGKRSSFTRRLLDRFPKAAEREPSLFGIIVALADVNQPEKAMARCEEYLRDFKDGPNAETVGYLLGAVALQANDPRARPRPTSASMLETQRKGHLSRANALPARQRKVHGRQTRRSHRGVQEIPQRISERAERRGRHLSHRADRALLRQIRGGDERARTPT